jgi:hypothetical protein
MRGKEGGQVVLRFIYSREARGGQRQRTARWRTGRGGGDTARPEEGDDPGRWAERASSAEWADLAAGLAKGFRPKLRI